MAFVSIAFAVCLVIGLPIAFVIGIAGMAHVASFGNPSFFDVYIQRIFTGVANNSYLCIPLFVLAGELLNHGGITKRLLDFVRELIGFVRGGLAYTMIIVAALLSAILGSNSAVTSVLCSSVTPELIKDGYDEDFAVTLSAAGGILGPIIPPGVSMVILAVITGVSVRAVFFAGIVPGLTIALGHMVVIFAQTRKRNYPKTKDRFSLRDALKALWHAGLSMLVPFVIVFGVMMGIFTPAEAGSVAVAIALICGVCYRTLTFPLLFEALRKSVSTSAGILFIIAFGNVLGWSFAIDQIPAKLSAFVMSMTQNPFAVLSLIMLMMLVIGFFLDGFSAVLIFGGVFGVLAESVGIDLVYFCIMFVVVVQIGLLTPPVGMSLFVASNVSGVPLVRIAKAIWPFVVSALICLFLLMCFPQAVLFIPNMMK